MPFPGFPICFCLPPSSCFVSLSLSFSPLPFLNPHLPSASLSLPPFTFTHTLQTHFSLPEIQYPLLLLTVALIISEDFPSASIPSWALSQRQWGVGEEALFCHQYFILWSSCPTDPFLPCSNPPRICLVADCKSLPLLPSSSLGEL